MRAGSIGARGVERRADSRPTMRVSERGHVARTLCAGVVCHMRKGGIGASAAPQEVRVEGERGAAGRRATWISTPGTRAARRGSTRGVLRGAWGWRAGRGVQDGANQDL